MDLTYVLVNATIARCRASTARNVTLLLVICTDLAILISNLSSVVSRVERNCLHPKTKFETRRAAEGINFLSTRGMYNVLRTNVL